MLDPAAIRALPYRPCVGVMLIDRRGRIFGGERRDTPGAWQMPQGGIDAGETPREAALRELREETGVAATSVEVLAEAPDWIDYDLPHELVPKLWKGRYRGQTQRWFLLRFTGRDAEIDIATDHPEFDRWRWMTAEDLLAAIVPFKRDTYARVIDEFRDHLA